MSLQARKSSNILFVAGALLLGGLMFFSFGGRQMLSRHESFVLYFDDTVNGLVQGSLVKFKGVPIGYVSDILLNYHQAPGDGRVPVLVRLNVDRLQNQLGALSNLNDPVELERQVRHGLRAELTRVSWGSGALFVNLNFYAKAPPPPPRVAGLDLPVIPTIASANVKTHQTIQDAIAWLPKQDFAAKAQKIADFLDNATLYVAVIPYAEYSQSIISALQPVSTFDVDGFQQGFDRNLARLGQYQDALAGANGQIVEQTKDFFTLCGKTRQNLEYFNDSLSVMHDAFHRDGQVHASLEEVVNKLTAITQGLSRQTDALEKQPSLLAPAPPAPAAQ